MLPIMFVLAGLILLYRWHLYRADQRAWQEAQWDCEDGEALRLFAMQRAREERYASLIAWSPVKAWIAFSVFALVSTVMLLDTWGTQGVWLALFATGCTLAMLCEVVYRNICRCHAVKAIAQDDLTRQAVDVPALRSLSPSAPRR